ncbi:MAG: hypothetical protein AAF549_01850 [Pseudomonadota bacterium]
MNMNIRNFNEESGAEPAPQGSPQAEGGVVDAVNQLKKTEEEIALRSEISEHKEARTEQGSAAKQAEQKLEDLQIDGITGGFKALAAGIQVVSLGMREKYQKYFRAISGLGNLLGGISESFSRSVNAQRTNNSLASARKAEEDADQSMKEAEAQLAELRSRRASADGQPASRANSGGPGGAAPA